MFSRVKSFFARLQTMSFKTMGLMINTISEESGKSKFLILCDMIWCAFRYGVGYLEYRVFGWVYIRGNKRKTRILHSRILQTSYKKENRQAPETNTQRI